MSAGAGASSAAMDQSQVYNYPLPTSTQHMLFSNKQTALRELQRAQKMHIDKCALPGSAPAARAQPAPCPPPRLAASDPGGSVAPGDAGGCLLKQPYARGRPPLCTRRLRKMKPSIDMSCPPIYPHVSNNAKRVQMEVPAPLPRR